MPDMIVASTTATQEEIDHAVSVDWRKPIVVEEAKPQTETVETEVPATSEEVETAPASEPESQQGEEKPKSGKGGFQKKIDKLTREKGEALAAKQALEEELASLKDRFAQIEKRLAPEAETKPEKREAKTSDSGPPKPLESEIGTKYKSWDEYNEALIEWKADRLLEARLAERERNAQERELQEESESRDAGYKQAAKEFAESTPEFNEAITAAAKAGMKLPEPIIDLIKELPNGPAVTYYLVTNPEEALALVEMAPALGFAMVGRISQGLEAEVKPAPKPAPTPAKKIVSAAPAAVKPVAGNSAKSGNSLADISARSTDEYIRARQAQIADRNARRY